MACALVPAVNLQTPPRFAPLSHQRAVKNEVSVMKKRMRFIRSLLLLLLLLLLLHQDELVSTEKK